MIGTRPPGEDWLPIESAPRDRDIRLAAYYQPSDEAARNGAKPGWDYGTGRWIYGGIWSGILGAKPTWWKEA